MRKKQQPRNASENQGFAAHGKDIQLQSWTVGALPLINRILQQMELEQFLQSHLKKDGPTMKLPTSAGLLLLVRNILLSREPIYGVGEWAQRHVPELLGIGRGQLAYLNDDRVGRCLDRLFDGLDNSLIMDVVRHVIEKFNLSLDELHNDSTTVTFHGDYDESTQESWRRGLKTLGITWGHNKDHRPDLKQLLYTLTVTEDGGVPVYFTTHSGNTADDTTHIKTWELLRELVGKPDFLYVADCKLASTKNLRAIDSRGGRFITVLPRTRREDKAFRRRLTDSTDALSWKLLYEICDDDGDVIDRLSVVDENFRTSDGFRLLWYFSQRKAEQDAKTRVRQLDQLHGELQELQKRLRSKRTRFRSRSKVEQELEKLLAESPVSHLLVVAIQEHDVVTYKQANRGRPSAETPYLRQVEKRYSLQIDPDADKLSACAFSDGKFPLMTNVDDLGAEEILRAYKRQPFVEKRFSQFKNDFAVAPVFLKDVARIQALLGVYFFALIVQTLLERELRLQMKKRKIDDLPLYPEGRPCKAPTTRRVVDLLEPVQLHELRKGNSKETLVTTLNKAQRNVLSLLGFAPNEYGR